MQHEASVSDSYITSFTAYCVQGPFLWIIMEYVGGGSALDLLKPGPIAEEYIAIILREILKGLDYLHSEKKLHRDIKGNVQDAYSCYNDCVEGQSPPAECGHNNFCITSNKITMQQQLLAYHHCYHNYYLSSYFRLAFRRPIFP